MEQIGDDTLVRVMRYCDGALAGEEASAVAAEIAADPKLQELAASLEQGAMLARDALAGITSDPIPLNIVRSIVQARDGEADLAMAASIRRRGLLNFVPREIAAACIGLVLGGAAIGLWSASQSGDQGLRLASAPESHSAERVSAPLKAALMGVLSEPGTLRAEKYTLEGTAGNEAEISVVAWFTLSDGSHCAELRHVESTAGVATGIACQDTGTGWKIMLPSVPD